MSGGVVSKIFSYLVVTLSGRDSDFASGVLVQGDQGKL